MERYTIEDIITHAATPCVVEGDATGRFFTNIAPISDATTESLVWIKVSSKNPSQVLSQTPAQIVICDPSLSIPERARSKVYVRVENPRLVFSRVAKALFEKPPPFGIHPTAFVDPLAIVSPKCTIGPFTYIGASRIGDNTVIHGHCHIYDNVTIGSNVTIHAGTIIGADGFGYSRNEEGEFEKFPHVGGIVIEDHVDIGANTCVDRGSLGNTIIREGAKIDNLVHIAHNVVVGRHAAVIANAMVGGSTNIGDFSWVAPSVALMNGISLGKNTTAGLGAVVTKSIPDGETWAGIPARPLTEFIALQKKLKELL